MKIEIQHNGITYAIQSYKKDDQANICPLIQNVGSIIIDLKNKKIVGTYGKADKYWNDIVSSINLDELINSIDNQFN
jgi:hypothetical protein